MRFAYDYLKFTWLAENEEATFQPWLETIAVHQFPLPPEIGEASIAKVEMAYGMTFFRATHSFKPAAIGRMVEIAEVEGSFPAVSLMIQSVNQGHILHKEKYPEIDVVFRNGFDLFRLADRLKLVPFVDGSCSNVMTALTVSRTALEQLVGINVADKTLAALGLLDAPSITVKPMPTKLSNILHNAIPANLTGASLRLACQSHALEYLSALIRHLGTGDIAEAAPSAKRKRSMELHEQLCNFQGKLPGLQELAAQFGVSAKNLNEEFKAEYGLPIHSFIAERRLIEAHAAIEQTDIPLKLLSNRLGYSHVNHFLTAFRKKFGYTPGSLRKKTKTS